MGNKINVAEILKDKPQGTKLYDLLRNIDVELDKVNTTDVGTYIECTSTNEVGSTLLFDYSKLGTEKCWLAGLRILLPSKNMRDWGKFAWKKGDLLINSCGFQCIFKEWASDDYTKFNGCYSNSRDGYEDVSNAETAKFVKLENNIAYGYVREIERKLGGILNLETLEIEKPHPEFKDGDIVALVVRKCTHIAIFQSRQEAYIGFHAVLCQNDELLLEEPFREDVGDIELRLATDSEKQQLFDALAKEGKRWDSEKKQIVNLKPKVELKPFDNVLVRHQKTEEWRANIFSHTDKTDEYLDYVCVNGRWEFCIPYEGNESLLGTTKDVEVSYGRSF